MDQKHTYVALLELAKQCSSGEELAARAGQNGLTLDQDKADEYFAKLHGAGELSDEELDAVSGGGCGESDRKICPNCGAPMTECQDMTQDLRQVSFHICARCNYDTRLGKRRP